MKTLITLPFAFTMVFGAFTALPLAGQIPGLHGTLPTAPAPKEQPTDPFGRGTPRGTIAGFTRMAHRGDYVTAIRYLEITEKQRANAETLAKDLQDLMDRYFIQPVAGISDSPKGVLDDGLPLDRERVGPIIMRNQKTDIILEQVDDPQSGPIWLVSSETLAQVPALHDAIQKSWIERVMPQPLLKHDLFGIPMAQWLLLLASIGIPLGLFSLMVRAIILLIAMPGTGPAKRNAEEWHQRTRWPLISVLTLTAHMVVLRFLGFSLNFRIIYLHVGMVLLVIAITWLIRRISAICFDRARNSMRRRQQTDTESLVLLSQRVFNVVIILAAVFVVLTVIGVDTRTALAGVGIGGVAIAFGAQKTVENLFGGISLITDKALAVGDVCRISNRQGTIEDITLRSIRLRTLEQTLLSIPAGVLSQENIENFATRKKILIQSTLQLRYGTSAEQLRSILEGIHRLLADHSMIETESARIRLTNFGERAIELELFAYVLTPEYVKSLAVREDILLHAAEIVESSGSAFAMPTQFVYLDNIQAGQETNPAPARPKLAS